MTDPKHQAGPTKPNSQDGAPSPLSVCVLASGSKGNAIYIGDGQTALLIDAGLSGIEIHDARIPVVANVSAKPVTDAGAIRENLVGQMTSPVLWEDSMRFLLDEGVSQYYEMGSGRVLRGLLRSIDRSAKCTALGPASSLEGVVDEAKGGVA